MPWSAPLCASFVEFFSFLRCNHARVNSFGICMAGAHVNPDRPRGEDGLPRDGSRATPACAGLLEKQRNAGGLIKVQALRNRNDVGRVQQSVSPITPLHGFREIVK